MYIIFYILCLWLIFSEIETFSNNSIMTMKLNNNNIYNNHKCQKKFFMMVFFSHFVAGMNSSMLNLAIYIIDMYFNMMLTARIK